MRAEHAAGNGGDGQRPAIIIDHTPISVIHAADRAFTLTIKDHRFAPSQITVSTDQKVKLVIKNLDPTPEAFESHDLNREKIVAAGSEITLYIGPLKAGTYAFFGEFNQDTAQGRIIAK